MIAGVEAADDLITSQAKFGTCTATTPSGAPQPTASGISPDQIYKVILVWCLKIRVKVKSKPRGKALGLCRTIQSAQNSSTSTMVELAHDSSGPNIIEIRIIEITSKVQAVDLSSSFLHAKDHQNLLTWIMERVGIYCGEVLSLLQVRYSTHFPLRIFRFPLDSPMSRNLRQIPNAHRLRLSCLRPRTTTKVPIHSSLGIAVLLLRVVALVTIVSRHALDIRAPSWTSKLALDIGGWVRALMGQVVPQLVVLGGPDELELVHATAGLASDLDWGVMSVIGGVRGKVMTYCCGRKSPCIQGIGRMLRRRGREHLREIRRSWGKSRQGWGQGARR
jgi:hypothetical protein